MSESKSGGLVCATRRAIARVAPIAEWGPRYDRKSFSDDLIAAVIVTIMLIPQSLAYALLAGLPPQAGLYASILPLVAYALFGGSRALAVGPVAVVSLMTAAAIARLDLKTEAEVMTAAATLAFMSGAMLLGMSALRLGVLANFLSRPVVSGFITASGLLIAASQLKHLLGVEVAGRDVLSIVTGLAGSVAKINPATLAVGLAALGFLFWSRSALKPLLRARGWSERASDIAQKAAPALAVIVTTLTAYLLDLNALDVKLVGEVPRGLPALAPPSFDPALWSELALSALLISVVGFVESVSVAQTLAAKKRQSVHPDQELIGLGASNIAAAVSSGYPVTGGFARSVVNYDAGAATQAAGAFTAVGVALATLLLTPLLFFLPKATLGAAIIVAVLSLVDFSVLGRTWSYSKSDFAAVAATIGVTLVFGVELGVSAGVLISLLLFLRRTAKPHIAELGLVPGTEHFRNVRRHQVETSPRVLILRVDESLYFANARYLEDYVLNRVAESKELEHVVLMCSAVNAIDASALWSLEAIDNRLKALGLTLHLAEVKGPVMDRLAGTEFLRKLSGRVFLSQYQAATTLCDRFKPAPRPNGEPGETSAESAA